MLKHKYCILKLCNTQYNKEIQNDKNVTRLLQHDTKAVNVM